MAKKKEDPPPAGSPAWMATFSDLMNLLLCFFVLLFSMSSVDAAKYDMVVNSLKAAFSVLESGGSSLTEGMLISSGISQMPDYSNYFGDTLSKGEGDAQVSGDDANTGQTGVKRLEQEPGTNDADTDLTQNEKRLAEEALELSQQEARESVAQQELSQSEQMAQKIEQLAAQYGIQDLLEIDFNGQYVRITLSGALLFDPGSAELNSQALPLVDKLAKIVNVYGNSIIEVEGHTDTVPMRSDRYENNDVLSMYRALYVADYLRTVSTVNPANIVSAGRGSYVPVADNATPEGRARNRRVEIKIYNELNSQEAVADDTTSQDVQIMDGPAAAEDEATEPVGGALQDMPVTEYATDPFSGDMAGEAGE